MIIIPEKTWSCMYCGNAVDEGKKSGGEHIVQECIGGGLTLNGICDNRVCESCNNKLSVIDQELCSKSHLSVLASQQLDAKLWQAWDIDHQSDNLIVESRPKWNSQGFVGLAAYPQLTFESTGPDFRGDIEETEAFGRDKAVHDFKVAVVNTYQRYLAGKRDTFCFEEIEPDILGKEFRYPPRLYIRRTLDEISKKPNKQKCYIRYVTKADRALVLESLKANAKPKEHKWHQKPSSNRPTIRLFFDTGYMVRALMKIGLNLLAAYCKTMPVNRSTFDRAMKLILCETELNGEVIFKMGFVKPSHYQSIAKDGCHSFRLLHSNETWLLFASFFGGKMCAFAGFPGPNHEDWGCLDVTAPVKSPEWTWHSSAFFQPLNVELNLDASAELLNCRADFSRSEIRVEMHDPNKLKK